MRAPAIKVRTKNKIARFNIYFSLRETYDNNKTKRENTMISRVQYIAHANLFACQPARARLREQRYILLNYTLALLHQCI